MKNCYDAYKKEQALIIKRMPSDNAKIFEFMNQSYEGKVEDILGDLERGELLSVVAVVRMGGSDQGLHTLTTYLPN